MKRLQVTLHDMFLEQRQRLFAGSPIEAFPLDVSAEQLLRANRPSVCDVLSEAEQLVIQPRCGVSNHEEMQALLKQLEHDAKPSILTVTIDSNTRLNLYDKAEQGLRDNVLLNGYPLINHGISHGRELVETVQSPLQVRHGSPDGRLLAEVTYAAGITAFEGGGISYNLPYCKAIPLRQSLRYYQYVDWLTGLLSDSVCLDRETFGSLTAVMMPPSISIAISILELLLAVEQGVKCVTIGYPETGSLIQDVAALQEIKPLCHQYLKALGLPAPKIFTSFHQWMGVFPEDQAQALALIGSGVVTAVIGQANKLISKTFLEASGVPTAEANAISLRFCQSLIHYGVSWGEVMRPETRVAEERYWLRQEVGALLDAVFQYGTDNLVESIVQAFADGRLDIPFSANPEARGAVIPARAANGTIRLLDMGQLPFGDAIRAFHRQCLMTKLDADELHSLVQDIYYMARPV